MNPSHPGEWHPQWKRFAGESQVVTSNCVMYILDIPVMIFLLKVQHGVPKWWRWMKLKAQQHRAVKATTSPTMVGEGENVQNGPIYSLSCKSRANMGFLALIEIGIGIGTIL